MQLSLFIQLHCQHNLHPDSINQSINQSINEHLIPHVGGRPGYKLQTELQLLVYKCLNSKYDCYYNILLIKVTAPSHKLPQSSLRASSWNLSIVELLSHSVGTHLLYPLLPVLLPLLHCIQHCIYPCDPHLIICNLETTFILLNTLTVKNVV